MSASCCRWQGSGQDGRAAAASPAHMETRAQPCQGATQTLLGSLASTAGLTPAQTQLLADQPQIKMGLSPEEGGDGSLSFFNQMILQFYNYCTTSFGWSVTCQGQTAARSCSFPSTARSRESHCQNLFLFCLNLGLCPAVQVPVAVRTNTVICTH